MPLKIIRNDITKMNTEAIVNTANSKPVIGPGCDYAVYKAAGMEELLEYRKQNIGIVQEGDAFITPGFKLKAKYIIHAISPLYTDGGNVEEKLRSCYQKSLLLAKENHIKSISFPLISTGSFGYPKEEGLRIAVDEINDFLMKHEMDVYLVVFDERATNLGKNIIPELETYIDNYYVEEKEQEEYLVCSSPRIIQSRELCENKYEFDVEIAGRAIEQELNICEDKACNTFLEIENLQEKLNERMKHLSDTFSEYLLYLIEQKGMENSAVYKKALVDKKTFSKIKNNPEYHPQKITALCLCVGAELNLDETKDLLARAGYALSPCDKTDIIFSYFIENEYFDMIEIDIQLEEHGLECIVK